MNNDKLEAEWREEFEKVISYRGTIRFNNGIYADNRLHQKWIGYKTAKKSSQAEVDKGLKIAQVQSVKLCWLLEVLTPDQIDYFKNRCSEFSLDNFGFAFENMIRDRDQEIERLSVDLKISQEAHLLASKEIQKLTLLLEKAEAFLTEARDYNVDHDEVWQREVVDYFKNKEE